jgi:hypothetical protein
VTLPEAPAPEPDSTSGRGLRIVDHLADDWGITATTRGKTVWFEIRLMGDPSPGPHAEP